jgi:L-fuculose-phosphate aldolase
MEFKSAFKLTGSQDEARNSHSRREELEMSNKKDIKPSKKQIKESIVKYAVQLYQRGLCCGDGGNLSIRDGKKIYISCHGLALEELTPDDIVTVDLDSGEVIEGKRKPSWEIKVHRDIYFTEPGVNSIIHVHPPYTNGLINGGMDFRVIIPEYLVLGPVPIVDYQVPASKELHDGILEAVKKNNRAIILRNHGFYTFGKNIRDAYYRAELIEDACKTALLAKLAGKPKFLTDLQIEELVKQLGALVEEDWR